MRAALIDQYRGLPRVGEVSKPQPAGGQSLVAVKAAALNPLDVDFASGQHRVGPTQFPYIPGFEGVGAVVESEALPIGQRVRFECRPTFATGGSLAEYAVVANEWAFPLPEGIPDATAAALGQVGITVWTALEWRAGLRPGEAVLVLGATGATGQLAVQVARLLGARRIVAAGRHAAALARTRELGADATVELGRERTADELTQALRHAAGGPIDVVLDALWGASLAAALPIVARGARIVNYGSAASPMADLPSALLRFQGITLLGHNSMLPPREVVADTYRRLVEYAARGEVTIALEELPLTRIAEAWQRQHSSPHTKLVVVL